MLQTIVDGKNQTIRPGSVLGFPEGRFRHEVRIVNDKECTLREA